MNYRIMTMTDFAPVIHGSWRHYNKSYLVVIVDEIKVLQEIVFEIKDKNGMVVFPIERDLTYDYFFIDHKTELHGKKFLAI